MLSADDQDGKSQASVRGCLRPLLDQRREIERSFRRPAYERILELRTQGAPCAISTPVVDKGGRRGLVVACNHAIANFAIDRLDFSKGCCSVMNLLEKMKGGRFIKRQACNAIRPLKGYV